MENFTNEEKDYYELLVDLLDNGDISDSERNILNKRKEKYSISDSRANEIEEFAKQERLKNLKPQNDSETSYYELILDFMENGSVSESNRRILSKRMEKYGITEARAKELEDFAKQEYLESKKVKFESEEEKEYYEFIVDLMENGNISENNRKILDKRKIKFGISETRAKELEEFAKESINLESANEKDLEEILNLIDNEEIEKAIDKCNKLLNANSNDYNVLFHLVDCYAYIRKYEEALKLGNKLLELKPNEYRGYTLLSNIYNVMGKDDAALEILIKSTELSTDKFNALNELAGYHYRKSEYDKAIEVYNNIIKIEPNDYFVWNMIGNCYNFSELLDDDEKYNKAIECFNNSIKLEPNSTDNYSDISHSYSMLKLYDKSIEALNKWLEIEPNNLGIYNEISDAYYYSDRYTEAIETLNKAIELYQKNNEAIPPYTLTKLGDRLRYLGMYNEAISVYNWALELDNEPSSFIFESLGASYYYLEMYKEAIEYFNKSIELLENEYNFTYWDLVGNSYLNVNDYNNAIYMYEKEIEINNGGSKEALNNYGVALVNLNRIEEAKIAYSKAIELDPNYELAKNNLQSLQSSNEGVSLNGIVSGISKGIDTLNEISGKIDPKTVTLIMGAAGFIGKILGGSNKNKS